MVGLAGGPQYQYHLPSAGVVITVLFAGGSTWEYLIQESGPEDWFVANGPLIWNAGLAGWEATFLRTRVTPAFCQQTLHILWRPQMIAGDTVRRGPIDELTNGGTTVLSWYHEDAWLPGHSRMYGQGGQNLWEPGHARGLTRRYLSTGLPPDFGPTVAWAP